MKGWLRASAFHRGIVLVIFAIFCEKDSSSCHGVRREGRGAQKSPKTGNTKKHFEQKIAKITKGETPAFPARTHYASGRAEKQLFRDISKRRHLMHFERFAYEKVAPRVGFPSRDRLSDLCDLL
jgi:hypothetical protein